VARGLPELNKRESEDRSSVVKYGVKSARRGMSRELRGATGHVGRERWGGLNNFRPQ